MREETRKRLHEVDVLLFNSLSTELKQICWDSQQLKDAEMQLVENTLTRLYKKDKELNRRNM